VCEVSANLTGENYTELPRPPSWFSKRGKGEQKEEKEERGRE